MGDELTIAKSFTLPLAEVSSITLRVVAGATQLCAIGDDSSVIVTGVVAEDGTVGNFERIEIENLLDSDSSSQWEAIAADGTGNVFVLQETPARVLVLDAALSRLVGTIELSAEDEEGQSHGFAEDENSKGEGLLLLRNGHLLVVKEKKPPLLIEFGPRGSSAQGITPDLFDPATFPIPSPDASVFVPLQSWAVDPTAGLKDLSDIAVYGAELYLVSDKGGCLVQIDSTLPRDGGTASVLDRWALPKRIKKPEGLLMFEGRRALVAIDHDKDKPNLFVLEPLNERA